MLTVCVALLAAGCFAPDLGDGAILCGASDVCPPDYVCRPDHHCWKSAGENADGGVGLATADLSMSMGGDLAGVVLDLASGGGSCAAAGARSCSDATHSAVCAAVGGTPVVDRACPPSSTCAGGHCQPPTGAAICHKPADCSGGTVCTPFVSGGTLATYCAPALPGASGGTYASCNLPGPDASCKSGYCVTDGANGSLHFCLAPCAGANQCPGGNSCDPVAAPATIEGAPTSGLSVCAM